MEFEWDEDKAKVNLSKHNDLRPEYDLNSLRVRRVGTERLRFGKQVIQLAPDVADVFPDSEAVNEALRFLIRITRENKPPVSGSGVGD